MLIPAPPSLGNKVICRYTKQWVNVGPYNYQKPLRKHMQGRVFMPCGLLFYVCWIIKMYICGKKMYTILKRDKQMIIEFTIHAQIISC